MPASHPRLHLWASVAALFVAALGPSAQAGSITSSSIWNRSNALDRARQQMPKGSIVTGERCRDVEVGIGNTRYVCTVEFAPPSPSPSPIPSPAPAAAPAP